MSVRVPFGDLSVEENTILNGILNREGLRVWAEYGLFKIGPNMIFWTDINL